MGQRHEGRKEMKVSVRIFGTDTSGKLFSETVSTLNISRDGVLLSGVQAELKLGETIGLGYGNQKGRFSVKWVGEPNSLRAHQVGLMNLTPDKQIWDFPLPQPGVDEHGRHSPGAERRKTPRFKCINSAEIHADGQGPAVRGNVVELAMAGCYVEAPITLGKGQKIKLAIWVQEAKLWVQAKVVTSRPGIGAGLQFIEISDQDSELLRAYLQTIPRIRLPKS
jgi:hypothetical protein